MKPTVAMIILYRVPIILLTDSIRSSSVNILKYCMIPTTDTMQLMLNLVYLSRKTSYFKLEINRTHAILVLQKSKSSIYHLSIGIFFYFAIEALKLNTSFWIKVSAIVEDRKTIGKGQLFLYFDI